MHEINIAFRFIVSSIGQTFTSYHFVFCREYCIDRQSKSAANSCRGEEESARAVE
ncbi:MAG: hypothetical protein HGB06_12680 [Chlorobaculum sp.]|nr:hypothetical protein [Chlorobaculum sp.]